MDDTDSHFLSPIYGDSDIEDTMPFTPEVSKTTSICSLASSQTPFQSTSVSERGLDSTYLQPVQTLSDTPASESAQKKLYVLGAMVSKVFFPNRWKGTEGNSNNNQENKPTSPSETKPAQKRNPSSNIDVECPLSNKVERANQSLGSPSPTTDTALKPGKSKLPLPLKKYATLHQSKEEKQDESRKSTKIVATNVRMSMPRDGQQAIPEERDTGQSACDEAKKNMEGTFICVPKSELKTRISESAHRVSGSLPTANVLPTYRRSLEATRQPSNCSIEENTAVTVAVRIRPLNEREISSGYRSIISVLGRSIQIKHPQSNQQLSFHYDFCFSSMYPEEAGYSSQEEVYKKLAQPLLEWVIGGYNMCLFAYGQTGSGKSYTMMGYSEEAGIIPRFCEELFQNIDTVGEEEVKYHIEMSYFEIYNEKIHDLLNSPREQSLNKIALKVREHPTLGPYVAGLSTYVVASFADVQTWLELGNKQRATAATGMNDKSSRSHSVLTLSVTQTRRELLEGEIHDHTRMSHVNLVDLAGSERCNTARTSGIRLKEGASINKSLLTLGKVICALSEMSDVKRRTFIPYRDSLLTWLLRESLGGNSKTAMIATVSPAVINLEESLSTLRYASQARNIINVARVNEDSSAALIRGLKAEIEKLKAAQQCVQGVDQAVYEASLLEIQSLRDRLSIQENVLNETQKSWERKLEIAKQQKIEEAKELQKAGVCFKVDNRLPNLVNLNEDPQLSEVLLYIIKEGQTKVGKLGPGSDHEIQLTGALIAVDHCLINNVNGTVTLTPRPEGETFVNGNRVRETITLHHGDRVILGGNHYFRFNHSTDVPCPRRTSGMLNKGREGLRDFEFAKNELIEAQKQRIESEIKEAKLQAQTDMMKELQAAKENAQFELTEQRNLYESRIKQLERELEEVAKKRNLKRNLNDNRAVTTRENLPPSGFSNQSCEVGIKHLKFMQVLEQEKEKLVKEVEKMQQEGQAQWTALQLSITLQEANKISRSLNKHTVFSRYDLPALNGEEQAVYIRVTNTNMGISTMWSQEKFEEKLLCMRELYQGSYDSSGDDVFYDPTDTWEAESKPLSPSRGRNSLSRQTSGLLLGKVAMDSAVLSSTSFSLVCKQLVISEVKVLGKEEDARNLILQLLTDLHDVWVSSTNLLQAYERFEFEDASVQPHLVKACSSFSHMVVSARLLDVYPNLPEQQTSCPKSQLISEMRKLGGGIAFLLHGCECSITSMIKSSNKQINQSVIVIAGWLGQISVTRQPNFNQDMEAKCAQEQAECIASKIKETFLGEAENCIGTQIETHLSEVMSLEAPFQTAFSESHKLAEDIRKALLPVAHSLKTYLIQIQQFWMQFLSFKTQKPEDIQDLSLCELSGSYTEIASHLTNLIVAWKGIITKGLQYVAERAVYFPTMKSDLEGFNKSASLLAKACSTLHHDTADQQPDCDLSLVTKDIETAVGELHSSARDLLRLVEALGSINCTYSGMLLPSNNRQLPGGPRADLGIHMWGRSRDSVRVAVAKWNQEALLREKMMKIERKRTG